MLISVNSVVYLCSTQRFSPAKELGYFYTNEVHYLVFIDISLLQTVDSRLLGVLCPTISVVEIEVLTPDSLGRLSTRPRAAWWMISTEASTW